MVRSAISVLAIVFLMSWCTMAGAQAQPQTGTTMGEKVVQGAEKAGEKTSGFAQKVGEKVTQTLGMSHKVAKLPMGTSPATLTCTEPVRDTLANTTRLALTPNQFTEFIGQFSAVDRQRLNETATRLTYTDLNAAIDRFHQAWKTKYNEEFTIRDRDRTYGDRCLSIEQGLISDPAKMTNWPLDPLSREAMPTERETYLQKGHDIAAVTYMPTHGRSELALSVIQEKPDNWRIDIPDTIDASTIKDNLVRTIDRLASTSGEWPKLPAMACRVVTRDILAAIYNVTEPGTTGKGMDMK